MTDLLAAVSMDITFEEEGQNEKTGAVLSTTVMLNDFEDVLPLKSEAV